MNLTWSRTHGSVVSGNNHGTLFGWSGHPKGYCRSGLSDFGLIAQLTVPDTIAKWTMNLHFPRLVFEARAI
jgi:hypothetical protein